MRYAAARASILIVLVYGHGLPQEVAASFEVILIKPTTPPLDGGRRGNFVRGGPGSADPGRVVGENQSLGLILLRAFRIAEYQLSGPSWLYSERYDFVAKAPVGATRDQIPMMLRQMLTDRFKLVAHQENREISTFELVIAKGGPKLSVSERDPPALSEPSANAAQDLRGSPRVDPEGFPVPPPGHRETMTLMTGGRPHMIAFRWSMSHIIEFLSSQIERPVADATGLKGEYDFKLTWSNNNGPGGVSINPSEKDGPTLFDAVQSQLGLKLLQKKGNVDVLVIDHIEKTPTPN
jgi:uncharacterized protein (TIGR03435 family)